MTREEAIEFGNMWLELNEDAKDSSTYTFFQMAIKALEQEPILDKIRAEIEELNDAPPCFDTMFEYEYALEEVLAIIDKYKTESEK